MEEDDPGELDDLRNKLEEALNKIDALDKIVALFIGRSRGDGGSEAEPIAKRSAEGEFFGARPGSAAIDPTGGEQPHHKVQQLQLEVDELKRRWMPEDDISDENTGNLTSFIRDIRWNSTDKTIEVTYNGTTWVTKISTTACS